MALAQTIRTVRSRSPNRWTPTTVAISPPGYSRGTNSPRRRSPRAGSVGQRGLPGLAVRVRFPVFCMARCPVRIDEQWRRRRAPVLEQPAAGHAQRVGVARAHVVGHRVRLGTEVVEPDGAPGVVVGQGGGGRRGATGAGAVALHDGRGYRRWVPNSWQRIGGTDSGEGTGSPHRDRRRRDRRVSAGNRSRMPPRGQDRQAATTTMESCPKTALLRLRHLRGARRAAKREVSPDRTSTVDGPSG